MYKLSNVIYFYVIFAPLNKAKKKIANYQSTICSLQALGKEYQKMLARKTNDCKRCAILLNDYLKSVSLLSVCVCGMYILWIISKFIAFQHFFYLCQMLNEHAQKQQKAIKKCTHINIGGTLNLLKYESLRRHRCLMVVIFIVIGLIL